MDITPSGVVTQPMTIVKKLENIISQEGLCIFNNGTDTYLLTLVFWISRGLWDSLFSDLYYCVIKLQNWIGGISNHFRLKFSPAHLFVQ
jgi:hypothetical protein